MIAPANYQIMADLSGGLAGCRDGGFGPEMCQIGPNWDKTGTKLVKIF